ncbi:tubulin glycylase 3A [Drosophila mojavensis]|uniref:tubulin glycylase 3A n=1 Tax=Drosophila mojavensis TaxID=7230 RepID=UPI001CD054BB|nr:tubulin glycylase 3A [Drosophila mojavensis]
MRELLQKQTRPSSEPKAGIKAAAGVVEAGSVAGQEQHNNKCSSATLCNRLAMAISTSTPTAVTVPSIELTPAAAPAASATPTPTPTPRAIEKPDNNNNNNKENCKVQGAPTNYIARRTWITTDRMNELRRKAQEAAKQNKIFTIRGCFHSVRNALLARGWVEKLDVHRKVLPLGQMTYEDLTQRLPKRKAGETRRQYVLKCERNIMSRFLEHMPVDFLWTNRKEKCDYIDQAKNPGMTINKFHRAPFTSKEGLCSQLRDFHWFFEEGMAEMYFPRCYNVWSPEELGEFVDNFKLTACVAYLRAMLCKYHKQGSDAVFSPSGKIPYSSIDFAYKRLVDYIDSCQHNDIDYEDPPKIWEHDWDAFLYQHQQLVNEDGRIQHDGQRTLDHMVKSCVTLVEKMKVHWPQYSLDGYQNLWIVKPANKCRGRGILLMDNLKKILGVVNPSIASKSRYVVQKYIERPLIVFQTKFDIRQWFLITNTQPLVVWFYRESYLRFSSQEYSLSNHHESVHLTNYAIQKKYTNGKRDKRLPSENMWDCYSFQAYLRQIGKSNMWLDRIYPGMRKAIVGTMLASQENMDRRPNTFELFGADFMICENFYPWLIEINSSPDLGATTSVTARMCPKCLEDVVKVVIDRRVDPKADMGNFELAYRQVVPPTPAYMGLNLFVKGKQLLHKVSHGHGHYYYQQQRKERSLATSSVFRQRSAIVPAATLSRIHRAMPTFNATEYMEKYMVEPLSSSRSSISSTQPASNSNASALKPPTTTTTTTATATTSTPATAAVGIGTPCPYLLKQAGRSITQLLSVTHKRNGTMGAGVGAEAAASTALQPKRQRSCGPRFANQQLEVTDKKFKILIKNYANQAADNLLEKQEPISAPATAPVMGERKWRSLRNINNNNNNGNTYTATSCSRLRAAPNLLDSNCSRRFARTKSEIESSASLHAIGRTFGRRSYGPRLPISISVQALHRGEPIVTAMKQASSEQLQLQLTQSQSQSPSPSQIQTNSTPPISPRNVTLANKLTVPVLPTC